MSATTAMRRKMAATTAASMSAGSTSMASTTAASRSKVAVKSHTVNCDVCGAKIVDGKDEAVFCDGRCQQSLPAIRTVKRSSCSKCKRFVFSVNDVVIVDPYILA